MNRLIIQFALLIAWPLSCAFAEPVTTARLEELSPAEQPAWKNYIERSQAAARADVEALKAEVAANDKTEAVRAPAGGDFKLSADVGDPWYAGEEANRLATVVLSYQTPSGGWSKKTDYSQGSRKPGMQWSSQHDPGSSFHYVATFDNRSTTEQMHFLANVWLATKRDDCREGFLKGLDYILSAQYPNGGWPQVYPLEGDYHDDITFNDNAMTHVLDLLHVIKQDEPRFAFVDEDRRQRTAEALAAGIRCVLEAQIVQDRTKTVWCGQHDALTLKPSNARKMEPPTLSGLESANVLKFLMSIPNPSPEIIASIESGLAWFERAKVTGLAKVRVDGRTAYEADPDSTEVYWARFYSLKNSRPVFPGRDGVLYDSFEAMAENNRLGYDFYTTLPGSVVNNSQNKWRKKLARQAGE